MDREEKGADNGWRLGWRGGGRRGRLRMERRTEMRTIRADFLFLDMVNTASLPGSI